MTMDEFISAVLQVSQRETAAAIEPVQTGVALSENDKARYSRPEAPDWSGERMRVRADERLTLEEPLVPTAATQQVGSEVQTRGTDALAGYLPFHTDKSNWGVRLRSSGLLYLAILLDGCGRSAGAALQLSAKVLREHEMFHFRAEVACSRAELMAFGSLYRRYCANGYASALEEALANARAWRRATPGASAGVQTSLGDWMRQQPPGYRDFERWLVTTKFRNGCARLFRYMVQYRGWPTSSLEHPWDFMFDKTGQMRVPVYLVLDGQMAIGVVKPFPKDFGMRILVHTREHPPPHVHIEAPPGQELTRYTWPGLTPLHGYPPLSSAQRKHLESYMNKYGDKIDKKVVAVYGTSSAKPALPG